MSETTTTTTAGGAPSVVVEPGAHTPAGQAGILRVHVRNLADGPRDMMITVIGLDDGWAPEPVRLDSVDADMTVSAEAALVPVTGAMAGEYPFVVVVQALVPGASAPTAAGGSRATTLVESTLTVDAPSEVLLAVEPADSRMRLRRRLSVVVSNTGTLPVEIALSTQTAKGLRLELPTEHITVPARQTVTLAARARNLRPQLTGHLDRRDFSVEARGLQAPARFRGTVTTRPLVTSAMIRVVALTMVVVMWGGGMLVGVPWLTQTINENGEQTTAQEAGGDDPDGTEDADGAAGADGEAGDGTGGTGGGAGDGAGAVDPGVRVGGVVTATDPSGVQVEIAPASIVADADGGEGIETDGSGDTQAMGTPGSGADGGGGGGGSFARAVPVPATVGSALSRDRDDEPLTKTSARALVLESTTALATSRSTSTDTDGTWAFVGLSPNINYLVTISKPGYQTVRHVVSGAEAAAGGVDVELVAGDGSLTGRVTGPGGAGQGGVEIVITDGTSTITTSTTTTGVVGSWSVEGLSTPSTYLVTASGTGLGAQSTLVTLAAGGSRTTDIALSQGVATLSGMVSGPDSLGFVTGLGGATVTASDGDVTRTASTVTGGLPGSFTLVDLPIPGRYTVTVEAPGFAPQTQEIDLTAGSSAAVLDVLLTSGSGVVQGTVRDPAGTGLSAAGLTLRNDEHVYKTMATSDGSGSFRFNGITPGDYVLAAEHFGHLTGYTTVRVGPGAATTADLVLTVVEGDGLVSTSRIRGRVSDARTNGQLTCTALAPGEQCLVTVSLTAQKVDGSQRPVSVTSDPNLEYLIPGAGEEGLLPGIYTLTVSAPGYEPGTVKVRVAMDQTVTAGQVALFPRPALTGTVLTRVGAVPAGTCVVAVPRGTAVTTDPCAVDGAAGTTPPSCTITAPARCAYTGDNGSYSMINLSSGTYQLTVRPGSDEYRYTQAPTEITLAPGDVRRFDATIDRLGRVAVTVLIDLGNGALTNADEATVTPRRVGGDEAEALRLERDADESGYVQLTHLPAGEYVLDVEWVSPTNTVFTGKIVGLVVADNQERSVPVVLTGATRNFTGRLVSQLKASGAESAGVHTVEISGVVGYNGLSAIRRTVSVKTGTDGLFRVFATAPTVGLQPGDVVLPLVADQVDIVVPAASGYLALNRSNIAIADDTQLILEMQPAGQSFSGTVELVGAGTAPGALFEEVTFEVLSAPPGAGTVSLAAGAPTGSTAPVVWTDLAQTAEGTGTLARPGEYRIRASLPGYDPVERTVVVNVGSSNTTALFILRKYGELRVNVLRSHVNGVEECQGATPATTCVPVSGPVVTLSINGMSQVGQSEPGTSFVDFGAVPSGMYTVVVQANGYERRELQVTVNAGDTRTANVHNVALSRLGVITGTVTTGSGGSLRALPGVAVTARFEGTTFRATTGADGTYRITGTILEPGLRDGDWDVTAALAGYQGGAAVTVPVLGGNDGTASFTMTADPVTVTIWVIDPVDNTGVDGLAVQLFNGDVSVPPTCVPGQVGAPCTEAAGSGKYTFQGVPPVQTTVQISGAGFRPLTVTVTPPPGQASVITVPITSIANTISGTVTGQTGAGSTSELEGAVVELTSPGFTSRSLTTPATGAFVFSELPDGTYVLEVTRTGYGTTARTMTVTGGQVYSIDVTLFESSRQVVVTLTSTSGYDLTGTLVSLTAGTTTLSGQPLARSTGSTYTTTFNQVPPGAWTATFSGAAGHPWSFTAPLGADATTLAQSVSEVRVQLSATSSASGAPGSLAVAITGGPSPAGTTQLVVGGPSETLYLRQVPTGSPAPAPYVVTAAPTGGWNVAPTSRSITRTETDVWAQFVLSGVATTTTLTTPPTAITVGTPQRYDARVEDATAGTVTFTLGGVTLGTGPVTPSGGGNGTASITEPLASGQLPLGSQPLVATYSGSGSAAPSASAAAAVLVQAATTVTMATPAVVELPEQPELSATVTPAVPGTVTFRRNATVLCTATTDGSAPATCTATGLAAGTHAVRATFVPTDPNYLDSTSAAVNAVVSPAPGP
ncbi:carboxypeptidase regulatory-like domain-containing protein [Sanguibacter sp. 25GB23B1]|uniref:carboxypeptidase regulatory-like domain-containing protein n=1 Tax=unclassified Sanguibacter TaxID=2645534 RepID=UPI0032AF1549